ncbi:hypothetical protein Bca101_021007 [Brassica carinata]
MYGISFNFCARVSSCSSHSCLLKLLRVVTLGIVSDSSELYQALQAIKNELINVIGVLRSNWNDSSSYQCLLWRVRVEVNASKAKWVANQLSHRRDSWYYLQIITIQLFCKSLHQIVN